MVRVRYGRLRRHTVTIKKNVEARNADGTYAETPITIDTRQVQIRPMAGRELFEAQQVVADVTHKISLRYDTVTRDIKPQDYWFEIGGRIWHLLSVRNIDERGRMLECQCKEKV
jgi:SPP1 family predicted phage head-tail adaptor